MTKGDTLGQELGLVEAFRWLKMMTVLNLWFMI